MRIKKFILACIFTSIILSIELLAATTGEILVALTMLSTIPLYIISNMNIVHGIESYICVAILLIILNPHQAIFFIFTNGILGLALGICDRRVNKILSILITGIILSIGIIAVAFFIGIFDIIKKVWYIPILVFIFSIIYVIFFRFIIQKVYKYIQPFLDKFI